MTKHLLNHFGQGWAELTETFLEAKNTPSPRLYYDGPTIHIKIRKHDWKQQFAALLLVEQAEWSLAPLQRSAVTAPPHGTGEDSSSGEDEMDVDQDDESDEAEDEDDEDEDHDDQVLIAGMSIFIDMSEYSDGDDSSSLTSISSDGPPAPLTAPAAPVTPPALKRSRSSPASTPSKTPTSSRPAKRPR
jgi:hypothetical protein